jgi:hypothetical protein
MVMIKKIVQVWVNVGYNHGRDEDHSPGMG